MSELKLRRMLAQATNLYSKITPDQNLSEALLVLDKIKKMLRFIQREVSPLPSEFNSIEEHIEYAERCIVEARKGG